VAGVDLRLRDPSSFAASSFVQGGCESLRVSGNPFQRRRELLARGPDTAFKVAKIIKHAVIPMRVAVIICC
jgi:hypothetical protein